MNLKKIKEYLEKPEYSVYINNARVRDMGDVHSMMLSSMLETEHCILKLIRREPDFYKINFDKIVEYECKSAFTRLLSNIGCTENKQELINGFINYIQMQCDNNKIIGRTIAGKTITEEIDISELAFTTISSKLNTFKNKFNK